MPLIIFYVILLGLLLAVLERVLPIILILGGAAFIWYLAAGGGRSSGGWADAATSRSSGVTERASAKRANRRKPALKRYYPRFRRSRANTGPKRKGTRTAFEKAMYPKPRKRK